MQSRDVIRQTEQRLAARRNVRERKRKEIEKFVHGAKYDWTKVEESADRLAQRAKCLGLVEDASALLRDPTDVELGARVFEKIIGTNNLLPVTFLSEGADKARAVARISVPMAGGRRLGTGFMVSSRIMMTNNHVLESEFDAQKATLEFDFYTREDGTTGPTISFTLQPEVFFVTDAPLDFTLVAVADANQDGVSVEDRGWIPLIGPSGKAVTGERMSIIQHPNGEPQQVTVHDNILVDVDPSSAFLHYETDTMGGSSGSPVFSNTWDLVALHHAAVAESNEGIRISSIVRRLHEIARNESASPGVRIDPQLFEQLTAGMPVPGPGAVDRDRAARRTSAGTSDCGCGGTQSGQLHIGKDRTARWTIPIHIAVGVGDVPSNATSVRDPAARSGTVPVTAADSLGDPMLREAIATLENTENLVYYSKVQDDKACAEYYPDFTGLSKAKLYDTLHELLDTTHTTTLTYKTARLKHLYPWIDRRNGSSRELKGIYSNQVFDALEVLRQEAASEVARERAITERTMRESTESVDEAFLESLEAAHPFNCEHVVPQSWFNKRKQPKTDLHHLFTCEWGCNSFRGNRAYFNFSTEAFRENCGESDHGKFEPKAGKGAVARATLYFLIRYPGDIADSSKEMPKDRLKTIIDWAKNDKVDLWERHRNAEIQKVQGNRNPLIDFPELVDKIDFIRAWV